MGLQGVRVLGSGLQSFFQVWEYSLLSWYLDRPCERLGRVWMESGAGRCLALGYGFRSMLFCGTVFAGFSKVGLRLLQG